MEDTPSNATTNGKHRAASKRRNVLSCFQIVMALIFLEVIALLVVGFLADPMSSAKLDWNSPLYYLDIFNDDFDNDDVRQMEDSLADKAERVLEAGMQDGKEEQGHTNQEQMEQDNAIDDYYTRKHISKEIIGIKVPLVVGGSDGSGTRAFVDVLGRLGVAMLVDDSGTMDIHGKSILKGKGWPPLASAVLKEMRSSNYNFEELSNGLQNMSVRELSKLRDELNTRGENVINKARAKNVTKISKDITYGFKAPVSMLLVPILQKVLGPMKYLHIVRDGRDVAMSQNQSPAKKFYIDSYEDGLERRKNYTGEFEHVMGMQLWNDWNKGLFEYEQKYADGYSFDFLVMRTEDLLNPEKKFKSLVQLATFVGSQKTIEELCCMSRKAVVDMGKSANLGDGRGRFSLFTGENDPFNGLFRKHLRANAEAGLLHDTMPPLMRMKRMVERGIQVPEGQGSESDRRTLFAMKRRNIEKEAKERDKKFKRVGDLIAKQFSDRMPMTASERARIPQMLASESRLVDSFDKLLGVHGNIDAKTQDMLGRRRLLGDESLLEKRGGESRTRLVPSDLLRRKGSAKLQLRVELEMQRLNDLLVKAQQRGDNKECEVLVSRLMQYAVMKKHGNFDKLGAELLFRDKADAIASDQLSSSPKKLLDGNKELSASEVKERHEGVRKGGKQKEVSTRYGKWVELLRKKPELSRLLHEQGAESLKAFGYEPSKRFQDRGDELDFVCDESIQCDSR